MSSEDLVREAQDPSTPPGRLAELAQADRATWPAIVFNPAAYDGLLQWLGERGDPTVNAALAARAAQAATLNPPTPPVPPAAPAFVEPQTPVEPAAQAPGEPEAPAEPVSPIAEPVVPAAQTPSDPAPEPAHEPTVVIPSQQAAPAGDPEPTAVFPSQQQPAYPAAPAATTAAFGSVPPGATPPHAAPVDGDGGGDGNNARTGKQLAIVVGVVVAVVALVGGAAFGANKIFGGDDDPTISVSDDATTSSPEPDDEPSTDAPSTDAPDDPSDGGDSAASGEFCTEMTDIQQRSMDVLGGGDGSTPDLGDIQDKSRELIQSYKDLEKIAPAEVKGDLQTMSSYLDTMMNPSSGSGADGMDAYFEAAQRLGVYYAQNCL
jgi:hypothetical protein